MISIKARFLDLAFTKSFTGSRIYLYTSERVQAFFLNGTLFHPPNRISESSHTNIYRQHAPSAILCLRHECEPEETHKSYSLNSGHLQSRVLPSTIHTNLVSAATLSKYARTQAFLRYRKRRQLQSNDQGQVFLIHILRLHATSSHLHKSKSGKASNTCKTRSKKDIPTVFCSPPQPCSQFTPFPRLSTHQTSTPPASTPASPRHNPLAP